MCVIWPLAPAVKTPAPLSDCRPILNVRISSAISVVIWLKSRLRAPQVLMSFQTKSSVRRGNRKKNAWTTVFISLFFSSWLTQRRSIPATIYPQIFRAPIFLRHASRFLKMPAGVGGRASCMSLRIRRVHLSVYFSSQPNLDGVLGLARREK